MSKKLLVSTVLTTLVLGIGVGAYADSALKQVTAYQNSNLQVKVNGKQIDQSSEDGPMYPLVYDGHSYVSAKGLAEAMGGKVSYDDATKTVSVSIGGYVDPNAGVPSKDNSSGSTSTSGGASSGSTGSTSGNQGSASKRSGSSSDPILLGSSFTYVDKVNYKEGEENTTSAKYTVTVNTVKPISTTEIEALGYRKPEANALIEYKLIDISLKVDNATFKKGSKTDAYYSDQYLSMYSPNLWGSKTSDGNHIIGGNESGFEGSWTKRFMMRCLISRK
ncbi:copper amine oxidase N-terminal domain-containing protein [Paenibacillus sp. HWE-109]|uniref:stalk domain-containing protein n=1 Tax=Paenibacillus sp. HWE-109 TaxID=1306526 RepID=UPI001EDE7A19|nr:stalk domain-containing protein [Paenibacillus sp. HWE-109]UKS25773.1 copper amine oxidase N-terminal domain-containing protein [Paenibacillus sp. HWE-109]